MLGHKLPKQLVKHLNNNSKKNHTFTHLLVEINSPPSIMKEEIRQLISKGKLDDALNKMMPFSDDVILLKSQLASAKRDNNMGLIERSEFAMITNRINYAALNLLDDMPDVNPYQSTTSENKTTHATEKAPPQYNAIPKVFFSYSHNDKKHLDDLLTYLVPLQRAKKIEIWTDTQILPGQEWNKAITDNLHKADIVIMLISADFLSSSYIWERELEISLQNREKGKTAVIPIILRNCLWKETILGQFQALPHDENAKLKPITQWADKDEAWYNVAKGIIAVVDDIK